MGLGSEGALVRATVVFEEATQMVSPSHVYPISKRVSDHTSAIFLIVVSKCLINTPGGCISARGISPPQQERTAMAVGVSYLPCCVHSGSREQWLLVLSPFSFLLCRDLQPTGGGYPCSGWFFPPQLRSLEMPSQTHPGRFVL